MNSGQGGPHFGHGAKIGRRLCPDLVTPDPRVSGRSRLTNSVPASEQKPRKHPGANGKLISACLQVYFVGVSWDRAALMVLVPQIFTADVAI